GAGGGGGGGGSVDEVVARSNAIVLRESKSGQEVPKQETPKQYATRVNRVLDKTSQHGIDSLTRDERRLLEDMSRKLRDQKQDQRAMSGCLLIGIRLKINRRLPAAADRCL